METENAGQKAEQSAGLNTGQSAQCMGSADRKTERPDFSGIRSALFDMDGTMYDTERLSTEGWLYAAKEFDVPLTVEKIFSFRGQNKYINAECFEEWFPDGPSYWDLRKVRDEYYFGSLENNGVPEKKGLRELLMYLREERKLRMAIVTGTSRKDAERYWNKTGILSFFDKTLTGDQVKVGKPDPQIYLLAAEEMQTPPENCLVFEDSPNGIVAAHRAGCRSILVFDQDRDMEAAALSDHYCDSLPEALEYLKKAIW